MRWWTYETFGDPADLDVDKLQNDLGVIVERAFEHKAIPTTLTCSLDGGEPDITIFILADLEILDSVTVAVRDSRFNIWTELVEGSEWKQPLEWFCSRIAKDLRRNSFEPSNPAP